jgi:hypothetical protein
MSDVVVGAVIGVVAAVIGALVQGSVTYRLQVGAEDRRDRRARRQAIREARLRALDQAHRMLVIGAEYARASAVGEDREQIASLRRQTESSNYLDADVTLAGDPTAVQAYLERTRWWLTRPRGTTVVPDDLATDAELANSLQAAFRRARERIEAEEDG